MALNSEFVPFLIIHTTKNAALELRAVSQLLDIIGEAGTI